MPVYKEPSFTIPGVPAIVQHEIMNNRRHVLTKVIIRYFQVCLCCYQTQQVASSTFILFYRILLVLSNYGRLLEEPLLKILARFLLPLDVLSALFLMDNIQMLRASSIARSYPNLRSSQFIWISFE